MALIVQLRGATGGPRAFTLPVPLTLPVAQWIGEAFLRRTTDHPLAPHIPRTRFAGLAVSTLDIPWRISFSRRLRAATVMFGGRPVDFCPADREDFHVLLEEALPVAVRPTRPR